MGRVITPTYRVEYTSNDRGLDKSMCWDCKRYGRPSLKNLESWREAYNKSFERGGVNEHVSDAAGFVIRIFNARIVRQATGEVVVDFTAPMFEVA